MAAEDGLEPRRPWLGYVCVAVIFFTVGVMAAGFGSRFIYEAARKALGL